MRVINILMAFLLPIPCFSQAGKPSGVPELRNESWLNLTDSLIKKEAAQFGRRGIGFGSGNDIPGANLLAVPLIRCTDKYVIFEKGSIYSMELLIHINSHEADGMSLIDTINLVFYKTRIFLPDSAFTGIDQLRFCQEFTKKRHPVASDCKAFWSADKKRVYIYMLNGEGKNRYEVTWVIQDRKYLTRIIDALPE